MSDVGPVVPPSKSYRVLAAVQSQAKSYVFLADPDGTVFYYESQVETEASANQPKLPPYGIHELVYKAFDKEHYNTSVKISTNTASSSLVALAYQLNGNREVRLYFVDAARSRIKEICSTNGGQWSEGSGSSSGQEASRLAPISGCVDYTAQGLLKIYFFRPGDEHDQKKLYVYFVTIGSQAWSTRPIVGDS